MVKDKTRTPKIWIFVVDSRNSEDLSDLDHFDSLWWGANPNSRKGDIVLIYRKAPYSDLAYVFLATSDPRPTEPADRADMAYVIELGAKIRLNNPITLKELRKHASLFRWSFARYPHGIMRRSKDVKQEGAWTDLRTLIVERNPAVSRSLAHLEGLRSYAGRPKSPGERSLTRVGNQFRRQLRVFISYASQDIESVRTLYRKLRREPGLDLWFDKESLIPADNWQFEIKRAILSADMILICLSKRSVLRRGFVRREINWALEVADQQPEGATAILPVKLEACSVPKRLGRVAQYAELFGKNQYEKGYEQIVAGLRKRSASLEETGTK